jgi:hypothetical protein
VYFAQAYAGHGVNATHLAGKLLAEAISGQQSDALRPVRPGAAHHLPGWQALAFSPLLALGHAVAPPERAASEPQRYERQNGLQAFVLRAWCGTQALCRAVAPIVQVDSKAWRRVRERRQNRPQRLGLPAGELGR